MCSQQTSQKPFPEPRTCSRRLLHSCMTSMPASIQAARRGLAAESLRSFEIAVKMVLLIFSRTRSQADGSKATCRSSRRRDHVDADRQAFCIVVRTVAGWYGIGKVSTRLCITMPFYYYYDVDYETHGRTGTSAFKRLHRQQPDALHRIFSWYPSQYHR